MVKADPQRVRFAWTPEGESTTLGVHVNSVSEAAQIPQAWSNTDLCPDCPAPSLALRCAATLESTGWCEETGPGVLDDPARLLYLTAVGDCQGVEGAP
jgi:hypothetical protein